ncbi:hypothetical protein ACH5RR_019060 [Cinchona calisaya]|uniref:Transcription repressor n=1 Tax=Cinchona calisaya TaxID=153742 RepID=A0ABD2ZN95_9GENT
MKLIPSIFKNKEPTTKHHHHDHHPLRQKWPSCKQPKTLSFRAGDDIFKTVNSVYFDPLDIGILSTQETQDSWFTNSSSESASFSTESDQDRHSGEESLEMIVRGVRSERLFFEPGGTSSMIKEEEAASEDLQKKSCCENFPVPLKESVVLAMESEDPYLDFKKSMEEMVETNGLKDWESLEELLGWYLKMNGKVNHGFIVGAFVDLLIGLAASSSNSNNVSCSDNDHDSSFLSASSSFSSLTSSPLSPFGQKEKKEICHL